MRSSLARYIKLKLPSVPASSIQRIADAARLASAQLGSHSPFKIIDLLGSAFRWFSLEEFGVSSATGRATYRDNITTLTCYRSGIRAPLTPGSAQTVKLYSDGGNFSTQASFDFNGSVLANKNVTVITYVRPVTVGLETNLGIYYPLHILGGDIAFGYNSGEQAFLTINGTTVNATGSQITNRNVTSSRFLSFTLNSTNKILEENEEVIFSGATQQIPSYTNGKIGGLSLNNQCWYGSISDVIMLPALTSADRSAIRKFILAYKGFDTESLLRSKGYNTYSFPFANSFNGNGFAEGNQTGMLHTDAIAVESDGTVYGNTIYDESGKFCFVLKNGVYQGVKNVDQGGLGICYDATYIYALNLTHTGGYDPVNGLSKFTVRRFLKPVGSPAAVPFSAHSGDIPIHQATGYYFDNITQAPHGISVTNTEIYVSDTFNNKIKIFDINTGAATREITVTNPQKIYCSTTRLYVIQKLTETTGVVKEYNHDGTFVRDITLATNPVALGDAAGRLLVIDNGSDKNIKVIDVTASPVVFQTFGNIGGLFATSRPAAERGKISDLYFVNLVDAQLNASQLFVVDGNGGYGATVQAYDRTTLAKEWETKGTLFLESAGADPDDTSLVYSVSHLFKVDYFNKSWAHMACTLNKTKYPDDDRWNVDDRSAKIVKFGGSKFLLHIAGNLRLNLFRFNPSTDGYTAIPCVSFKLTSSSTLQYWSDTNGNGLIDAGETTTLTFPGNAGSTSGFACCLDDTGNLWTVREDPFDGAATSNKVYKIPMTGINASGVPVYDFNARQEFVVADFRVAKRIHYFEGKLWISGVSQTAYISPGFSGFSCGDKICSYVVGASALTLVDTVFVPYLPSINRLPKDFQVLDGRIYVGFLANGAFYDPKQQLIEIYQPNNKLIARLNFQPLALDGDLNWFDVTHPFSVTKTPEPNKVAVLGESISYNRNQAIIYEFAQPKISSYPLVSSDLRLWLEADKGVTTDTTGGTTTVASWKDNSQNELRLTQATKASQFEVIQNTLNGFPVFRATTNRSLQVPNFSLNGITVVALAKYQAIPGGYWTLLTKTSGGSGLPFDIFATAGSDRLAFAGTTAQTTALDPTKYQIISYTHDKSVGRYYLNGVADGTANGAWNNNANGDTGNIWLGQRDDGVTGFRGDLVALFAYNTRNDKARQLAEEYLRQKYAIVQ